VRFPNDSQRHMIYGKTGSGKTVAGLWALEKRDFLKRPWVILDFKRDGTIAQIPRLEEIDINSAVPKQPGLYVTRPLPNTHEDVERFLWRIWEKTKTGIMIDEAFMIDRFSKAYSAILTQGRSLRIPVIGLSQRPSWLNAFHMSEADFHQVFYMQNPADIKKLMEWVPYDGQMDQDYHSYYFDVAKGKLDYLAPVPTEQEILDRFDSKMPRRIHLFRGITTNAYRKRKGLAAA